MAGLLSLVREGVFYRDVLGAAALGQAALTCGQRACGAKNSFLRQPIIVNFFITSACNFNCIFCNYARRNTVHDSLITAGDIERWLKDCRDPKPFLFFGGGEPFVREDMMDILERVKRRGFRCGVNTNGYFMDEKKTDRMSALGVELAIVSLYGSEELHDRITGVAGSFRRSVENMRRLCASKSRRTKVVVCCVLCPENVTQLEEVARISQEAGADAVKFEHLNFVTRSEVEKRRSAAAESGGIHTFVVSDGAFSDGFVAALGETLRRIERRYGRYVLVKPALSLKEMRAWYADELKTSRKCFFAWHSLFVREDGKAVPCQFLLDYILGDIRTDSVSAIFQREAAQALRRRLTQGLLSSCSRCCKL